MAWAGRTPLEKEMRKANDRLRALENAGLTSSPAYQNALRAYKAATGDATVTRPRFTLQSVGKLNKQGTAALHSNLNRFLNNQSTVREINAQVKKTQKTYSQHAGRQLSKQEALKIGNIWEGLRHGSYKYEDSAVELSKQDLILKGIESGLSETDIVDAVRSVSSIGSIDQWEENFDDYFYNKEIGDLISTPGMTMDAVRSFVDTMESQGISPLEWHKYHN